MGDQILIYIFIFVFGAAFGSFLNVCIYRIPRKESIVFPSSHCPICKVKIKPINNIPIISFILLKGKCKNCNTCIHWHYLLIEILTPLLFFFLFLRFGNRFSIIFIKYIIFFSIGLIIFFVDLFHKIIPDVLSLPLIPIGIILSFFTLIDVSFKSSITGAIFGFMVFFLCCFSIQYNHEK